MSAAQEDFEIKGFGEIKPPPGMTIEEMDRLAREADERRKALQED